jgi:2,3-bisphosphoglycerate-dependent phosphoglycerate mutase
MLHEECKSVELYLIRHAQSANNARPEEERVEDPPLTDLGHEQARHLGQWLVGQQVRRLITSPFLRTLQTADHIRRATGLTPEVRVPLHEQGGCYAGYAAIGMVGRPGMTRLQIEQRFPGFRLASDMDGRGWWDSRPHETRAAARRRAAELLRQTCAEFVGTANRVAYVTHADITQRLVEHLGMPAEGPPWNGSVTRVVLEADAGTVVEYNRVAHLPRRLASL